MPSVLGFFNKVYYLSKKKKKKFLKPFLVTSFFIALPKRVVMSVLCDQVA
jgi:hypothetical protein